MDAATPNVRDRRRGSARNGRTGNERGAILLGRKNREIIAERNSARIAAAQTQAVNAFLTDDLLGQADPDANSRDKQVSVEELLRRAAAKIDGNAKFAGQPEVEGTLRLTLGKTFLKLSNIPEAEKQLRRAVELRRGAFGTDDPATLAAQEALADFLTRAMNRYTESVPLARQTWQGRSRVLGPEHPDTLDSLDSYASALARSGQIDEGITHERECLNARRRTLGPRHPETLVSMGNLGYFLSTVGKWSEAVPLLRDVCDADREAGRETRYAATSNVLALSLYLHGDLDDADRVLHDALDRAVQKLSTDSLQADFLRGVQVKVWIDRGETERAVTLGRLVVAARRKLFPAKNVMTGSAEMDLGRASCPDAIGRGGDRPLGRRRDLRGEPANVPTLRRLGQMLVRSQSRRTAPIRRGGAASARRRSQSPRIAHNTGSALPIVSRTTRETLRWLEQTSQAHATRKNSRRIRSCSSRLRKESI